MKRKLITCLLAMTMAAGLAACGSTKTSTTSDNTKQGSTTDDAASDTSGESADESDNSPSEVTPDTLNDFPVSKYCTTATDSDNNTAVYYAQPLDKESEKLVVVPAEIIVGDTTITTESAGEGDGESDLPFCDSTMDETEAIVFPKNISSIHQLWRSNKPKKLKYILLPTKFENTGLEEKYDPDNEIKWIYEDVEGKSYKKM